MTNAQLTIIAIRVDAADRRKAWDGMNRELNANPPRQPVQYAGCSKPINTRERYLNLKKRNGLPRRRNL